MKSRVIAHVDMDAFFAAVEQRDDPALLGQPVIIGSDPKGGQGRGVVATCSYEARRYGVHSAQPISVAWKKCPRAVFLRGDYAKYQRESRRIFSVLENFTPEIEPVSIDEAFLDLSGSYHFYQTPKRTARAIKEAVLKETGLTASIGMAPVKFVAKIASDECKPDGLLVVPPREVLAFLRPLPVERLWGVGPKTRELLNRCGMKTIGDLAACPRDTLIRLCGSGGASLQDLANGIDPRPVMADGDVRSVSHEYTFDEDERDPDVILRILLRLTEKVSRRLRQSELKGRTVSVKIRTTGFVTHTRAETLAKRVDLIDDIYPVARKLFEVFWKAHARVVTGEGRLLSKGLCVRLIGVRVSGFEDAYVMDSLFGEPGAEKRDQVQRAMDRIKDKFGEDAIHRGV